MPTIRRCCIVGCSSNSRQSPQLQFFAFPKPENPFHKVWRQACHASLSRILPFKKPVVCALHFHPNCIGGRRLISSAVPSLRLEVPSNLKAVEQQAMMEEIERSRKCAYINAVVYEWLVRANLNPQLRGSITHGMIKERAETAKQIIGSTTFTADNRWLNRFRETHLAGFAQKLASHQLKPLGNSLWIPDIVQELAHLFPPTSADRFTNLENVPEQYIDYMQQYGEYEEDDEPDVKDFSYQEQQQQSLYQQQQYQQQQYQQHHYQQQQQQHYQQQQQHHNQSGYDPYATHQGYNYEDYYYGRPQHHQQNNMNYSTPPPPQRPSSHSPPQQQQMQHPHSQPSPHSVQQQLPQHPQQHTPQHTPQHSPPLPPLATAQQQQSPQHSQSNSNRSSPELSRPPSAKRLKQNDEDIPLAINGGAVSPVEDLTDGPEDNPATNGNSNSNSEIPKTNGSVTPNGERSAAASPKSGISQSNGHAAPVPSIASKELLTYSQALEYLKPIEEFALFKENFRAIGLISQLEIILRKGDRGTGAKLDERAD